MLSFLVLMRVTHKVKLKEIKSNKITKDNKDEMTLDLYLFMFCRPSTAEYDNVNQHAANFTELKRIA